MTKTIEILLMVAALILAVSYTVDAANKLVASITKTKSLLS